MKLVEVLDDRTSIKTLAIKLVPETEQQRSFLVDHSGFDPDGSVLLIELDSCNGTADPYEWPSIGTHPRTLPVAHKYLIRNFDEIREGGVVNVGKILGAELNPAEEGDDEGPSFLEDDDN